MRPIVVLLCQPSQRASPLAVSQCAATASASSRLKSKFPPTHSLFGQSKRNKDLAKGRLKLHLSSLCGIVSLGAKKDQSSAQGPELREFLSEAPRCLDALLFLLKVFGPGPNSSLVHIKRFDR